MPDEFVLKHNIQFYFSTITQKYTGFGIIPTIVQATIFEYNSVYLASLSNFTGAVSLKCTEAHIL